MEDGGFVGGNIDLLVGVCCHLGFGSIARIVVQQRTFIVEQGALLSLMGTIGGAFLGEEDIAAIKQVFVIHDVHIVADIVSG